MRNIWLSALILSAAACGSSPVSLVVVTVSADQQLSGVTTLHGSATAGNRTVSFDVHPSSGGAVGIPPSQTFGIDIPRSITGAIGLQVEARDASGTPLGAGQGGGTISVGKRADIGITLKASTSLPGDMGSTDMPSSAVAMLTMDKSTQDFGNVVIKKGTSDAVFKITNNGADTSGVPMLSVTATSEWTITTDCSVGLAPGAICHVTASVIPMAPAGAKQASFTLTASPGGTLTGTLTANALTPGNVAFQQPSFDFGGTLLNTQSTQTGSFTVKNTGQATTGALTVGVSDPEYTPNGCAGQTLAPGGTCTILVQFKPVTSGSLPAQLTVTDPNSGSDTASLSGVGLKPAALSLSPLSPPAFTTTPRAATGNMQTFTVSNGGDVAADPLQPATLSSTSYTMTDNCSGMALGPAPASCTIVVTFTPQVSGANNATLTVQSKSATTGTISPVGTASLSGTGTPAWTAETVPANTPQLFGVWVARANNLPTGAEYAYAVGAAGTILFRNAATGIWQSQSLTIASPPDLVSISGDPFTPQFFVAGYGGIYQSNGNGTWSQFATGTYTNFSGISVLSSADFYATGGGALYHWSQNTFTQGPASGLWQKVWAGSDNGVYVYGSQSSCPVKNLPCSTGGEIAACNGGCSNQYSGTLTLGSGHAVTGVFGFGNPPSDLYATQGTDVILQSYGSGTWTAVANSPTECNAVWGVDKSHLWFACFGGVYTYDEVAMTFAGPVLGSTMNSIWGTDANNVYAVGSGGIYHYF